LAHEQRLSCRFTCAHHYNIFSLDPPVLLPAGTHKAQGLQQQLQGLYGQRPLGALGKFKISSCAQGTSEGL